MFKLILVIDGWGIFWWDCPQNNVIGHNWWWVNIGSGNGLLSSGNKSLPEPILTEFYGAIWRHWDTPSKNAHWSTSLHIYWYFGNTVHSHHLQKINDQLLQVIVGKHQIRKPISRYLDLVGCWNFIWFHIIKPLQITVHSPKPSGWVFLKIVAWFYGLISIQC